MEKVLKLSEILSETFTLFFTSEVYVGFLWPYTSDRTINIKKLQVTQDQISNSRSADLS